MRLILSLLFAGLLGTAEAAPLTVQAGTIPEHPAWRFWDLTIDLTQAELAVSSKPGGAFLETLVPQGAAAAFNGGYFLKDYRPAGWLLDASGEISPRNRKATRGGVLALKGTRVYIGKLDGLPFEPEFAVQNSPRLVEEGGSVGIRSDDGRRAARTVVCVPARRSKGPKPLHVILIQAPTAQSPTLMETAQLLAAPTSQGGFGCATALNLDGGPSTGLWLPSTAGAPSSPPPVPIGYAIVVREKAQK